MQRTLATLAVVALLVLSLSGPATADDPTQIDNNHGLDSDSAKTDWQNSGYAEGEVDGYDMMLTMAQNRDRVADQPTVTDFSDWLRIDYDEEIERTLRIHIPAEYGQPYEREGVASISSDHVADYKPVRNGNYLQVTVHVDGKSEIVLPMEWDGQTSYWILDRFEDRIDRMQQLNPLQSDVQWQEIESNLSEQGSLTIGEYSEQTLVQVDARPDQPNHHWIPAPQADAEEPVFYHVEEQNSTEQIVVTSTVDEPPAVRYGEQTNLIDRLRSEINSAQQIPRRIFESFEVPDWVPVVS